jgi:hypothetical protein
MGVRDHQLDAFKTALDQALQEGRPERLGLGGTKAEADDLAPTVGIAAIAIIAAAETMRPPSRTFK